jgi:transposase-like protein
MESIVNQCIPKSEIHIPKLNCDYNLQTAEQTAMRYEDFQSHYRCSVCRFRFLPKVKRSVLYET